MPTRAADAFHRGNSSDLPLGLSFGGRAAKQQIQDDRRTVKLGRREGRLVATAMPPYPAGEGGRGRREDRPRHAVGTHAADSDVCGNVEELGGVIFLCRRAGRQGFAGGSTPRARPKANL